MRLGVVKYPQDGGCGPTKGFYFLRSASSKAIRRRALTIACSEVSLTRLSHLEGIRTHNHNVMSERYPKVFTTKRVLNYRKRGASTGSDGGSAMAGFLILGLGWAGNSIRSVSSRICTSSDGWV